MDLDIQKIETMVEIITREVLFSLKDQVTSAEDKPAKLAQKKTQTGSPSITSMIDHTLLKPDATAEQIAGLRFILTGAF